MPKSRCFSEQSSPAQRYYLMHSAPYKTLAERLQWVKEDPVQSPCIEASLTQGKNWFSPLKAEFGLESKTQQHKFSPTRLTDQETLYLLFAMQTNVTCTFPANKVINSALIFIAGDVKNRNTPKWLFCLKLNLQQRLQSSQKPTFSSLWQIELPLDFQHFLSPASEK